MSDEITQSATWREIMQQPAIWREWADILAPLAENIRHEIKQKNIREIWFCGAGTSSFIGDIASVGATLPDVMLRPVATTDFISCPEAYLNNRDDILVVQFGRSGDSSETIAMLDMLDVAMPKAHRLHITCNAKGVLATRQPPTGAPLSAIHHVILLPEPSCDRGFAMTSSFSTMLLTALACFLPGFDAKRHMPELAQHAAKILNQVKMLPLSPPPQRVIFLGSGPLKALAREAALKVLELSAGHIMTSWDCPLGFRHGPKAAIHPQTRLVFFIHPAYHTARYERDLHHELRQQFPDIDIVTLGSGADDIVIAPAPDARISAVLYLLAAQIWSVQWSAALGLTIDNPFANGTLSRVIEGVRIYPWEDTAMAGKTTNIPLPA